MGWKNETAYGNAARSFVFYLMTALLIALVPSTVFAAVEYGAEIVDAEGVVIVTIKATSEVTEAFVGQKLKVGDSIETGNDGVAEILFDDGNVTRIDENTLLTIKALSIEGDGSRKSVLGLAFGRIKNAVSKLEHKRSRFEVHTKSAVAGVRGTPEWVVGTFDGKRPTTEIDLLGKTADTGSVFVKGKDRVRTEVLLKPRTRTVVALGLAPTTPFAIDPDRLNMLNKILPIKTTPEKREEKRKAILLLTEEITGKTTTTTDDSDVVAEHLAREVSEGDIVAPSDSETGEETDTTSSKTTTDTTTDTDTTTTDDSDVVAEHLAREVSEGDIVAPSDSETGEETETQVDTTSSKTTTDTTTTDTSLTMDHITRKVSVGEIVAPSESTTGEETETQGSTGTTEVTGTTDSTTPSTTTTTIRLNFNFQ